MINYIIFTIFITFFTLTEISKRFVSGLLLAFFFIFIAAAIRYDYGYDYLMYAKEFVKINKIDATLWPSRIRRLEYGWIYLNKLFAYVGFNYLIIFLSLIYSFTFSYFIKNTLDKKLYPIAVLLFLLIPGIFMIQQTLLRQTVAVLLFLISIILIQQEKPFIWSLTVLLFAQFFHHSALLLLPVLFTKFFNLKKVHIYFILVLYVILFFTCYYGIFASPIFKFINFTFPKYSYLWGPDYYNKIRLNSGLGLIFSSLNFFIILFFREKFLQKNSLKIMFYCIIIFYLITPLCLLMGYFQRLNFYFEVFFIIIIPMVYSFIANKKLKYLYLGANILFASYNLVKFFQNDLPEHKFSNYQTIFR